MLVYANLMVFVFAYFGPRPERRSLQRQELPLR
jgi:hypothetical protein